MKFHIFWTNSPSIKILYPLDMADDILKKNKKKKDHKVLGIVL